MGSVGLGKTDAAGALEIHHKSTTAAASLNLLDPTHKERHRDRDFAPFVPERTPFWNRGDGALVPFACQQAVTQKASSHSKFPLCPAGQ